MDTIKIMVARAGEVLAVTTASELAEKLSARQLIDLFGREVADLILDSECEEEER